MEPNPGTVAAPRRKRWWTPLLLPAVVIVIGTIASATAGTRVVHNSLGGGIIGDIAIVLFFCLPAFAAGRRFGDDRKMKLLPDFVRTILRRADRRFTRVAERI